MPSRLAAVTGLDALCQAIESLWATGGDEQSAHFAEQALRLISRTLVDSSNSGDPTGRGAMMLGAHLAGHAINRSKTTAPHALSYAISQRFKLPHGLAVACIKNAEGQMQEFEAEALMQLNFWAMTRVWKSQC